MPASNRPAPLVVAALVVALAAACTKKVTPEPTRAAASAVASAAASASVLPDGRRRYVLDEAAVVKFTIDAPLEKITGETHKVRGTIDVDLANLSNSTGVVEVNLMELYTTSFADEKKNTSQTEHAHDWLELGAGVPVERRDLSRWAKLNITKVMCNGGLATVEPFPGTESRPVGATIIGDLTVHGVTVQKKLSVSVTFEGPVDAPKKLSISVPAGFAVALSEHDVKPRDALGNFMAGALAKIGKKIDDKVFVAFYASAQLKK